MARPNSCSCSLILTPGQRRQTPTNSLPTPNSSSSQVSPSAVLQSIEAFDNVDRASPITVNNEPSILTFSSVPDAGVSHAQCQPFHRAASAPPLDYQRPPEGRRNTGFQGPTSHFTILTEGLGILEPDPTALETMEQQQDIVVTNSRIDQGCRVLSFFSNKSMINRFISRWHEACEGSEGLVISPIMKEWLHQLWLFHEDTLTSQDPIKIRKLSERIWRNTLSPLEFDGSTTAKEWARLGSGLNLRWEVLGLISLSMGFAVIEAPPTDPIFLESKVSRSCVLGQMKQISEKCLIFCRHCEVLDDMFIWLLMEYSVLIQATKVKLLLSSSA